MPCFIEILGLGSGYLLSPHRYCQAKTTWLGNSMATSGDIKLLTREAKEHCCSPLLSLKKMPGKWQTCAFAFCYYYCVITFGLNVCTYDDSTMLLKWSLRWLIFSCLCAIIHANELLHIKSAIYDIRYWWKWFCTLHCLMSDFFLIKIFEINILHKLIIWLYWYCWQMENTTLNPQQLIWI